MKKFLAVLCTALLLFPFAACSSSPAGSAPQNTASQAQDVLAGDVAGSITISCYDTMKYKSFLEEAAKAFEEKYPGTSVTVSTFSAMPEIKRSESEGRSMAMITQEEDTQARSDYINKINTELMGGQAADILAVDILPFYKYAENGQLENLADYMSADPSFRQEDYLGNILSAVQYQGGQYVFPLDYSFSYLAYDSSLFSEAEEQALLEKDAFTYEELVALAQEAFARNLAEGNNAKMFGMPASGPIGGSIFDSLLEENYGEFVDIENKVASFHDGTFSRLLEQVQKYDEMGYLRASVAGGAGQTREVTPDFLAQEKDERYYYKTKNSFSLLQYFNDLYGNRGNRVMFSTGGIRTGNEENDKIAGLLANARGQTAFTYSQAFALNANSENKRTAWEFIKFLAGEDMQTSLQLSIGGFPVHNGARAEKMKMSVSGELFNPQNMAGPENSGAEMTESQKQVLDSYTTIVEQFSAQLNTCLIKDDIITNAIGTEANYFFSGEKTAEEVASNIQNKVSLYLNE